MTFTSPELVTIAGFPLLKYGSLKRKEAKFFAAQDKEIMRGYVSLMEIAQEVAAEYDIDPTEAYNYVAAYGSGGGVNLLIPYAGRLAPLMELLTAQESAPANGVTMFLASRLSPEWVKDNAENLKSSYGIDIFPHDLDPIQKTPTGIWESAYTDELTETTIESLWEFVQGERKRWVVATPEPEKSLGEDLPNTESTSPPTPISSGTTTTGESNSQPLEIPVSTEIGSTSSPAEPLSTPAIELTPISESAPI